jgi:hypothetical protein
LTIPTFTAESQNFRPHLKASFRKSKKRPVSDRV